MTDEGGEKVIGRRVGEVPMTEAEPTGSYLTSEGSSTETEEDVATEEEIPAFEDIMRKREEARRTGTTPPPAGEETGGTPSEEPDDEILAPHDRGSMKEIE